MATNIVQICGDESNLLVKATNVSGATPIEFESGSFKGSAEEYRLVLMTLLIGATVFNLSLKWTEPTFNRTSVTGTVLPRGKL